MHDYKTAYDVSTAGFEYLLPALIGVFLGGVFVVIFIVRGLSVPSLSELYVSFPESWRTILPLVCGAFAWLLTIGVVISGLTEYAVLRGAESRGEYKEAIGQIEGFQPWLPHRSPESFWVNNVQFSLTGSDISPGFTDTSYPLRDGLCVRIWYVRTTIVRLDEMIGNSRVRMCP